MSSLWILPTVAAGVGLVVAVFMGLRALEELRSFKRQVRYLGELRPALVEVRDAGRTLASTLTQPRRT